jgi:transketolase
MRAIPGMTVINPSDAVEAAAALKYAIETDGPFYIRFGRYAVPVIHDSATYTFEPGKGETLIEGDDLTIIATGMMIKPAIEASAVLSKARGISVRVINLHTVKPLDCAIIKKAARETGAIVVAEEHNVIGGLGSAVAEYVAETCPCPVLRVGVMDTFGRSGKVPPLLDAYGLNPETIVEKATVALQLKDNMKG